MPQEANAQSNVWDMQTWGRYCGANNVSSQIDEQSMVQMSNTHMLSIESEWKNIDWRKVEIYVFKQQKRIFKAAERGELKLVRNLQRGQYPGVSSRFAYLMKTQKGKCTHCGLHFKHGDVIETDHKIPRSKGGRDKSENLQLLHRHCHDLKTALDLK